MGAREGCEGRGVQTGLSFTALGGGEGLPGMADPFTDRACVSLKALDGWPGKRRSQLRVRTTYQLQVVSPLNGVGHPNKGFSLPPGHLLFEGHPSCLRNGRPMKETVAPVVILYLSQFDPYHHFQLAHVYCQTPEKCRQEAVNENDRSKLLSDNATRFSQPKNHNDSV